MPTRKRLYNNLLEALTTTYDSKDINTLTNTAAQSQPLKTKADIFISALLYGALERI